MLLIEQHVMMASKLLFQAIVSFAALGQLLYRSEKFENEAILLLYLRRHANTSVPQLLGIRKFSLPPHIGEEFAKRDLAPDPLIASKTELQNLNPNMSELELEVSLLQNDRCSAWNV